VVIALMNVDEIFQAWALEKALVAIAKGHGKPLAIEIDGVSKMVRVGGEAEIWDANKTMLEATVEAAGRYVGKLRPSDPIPGEV